MKKNFVITKSFTKPGLIHVFIETLLRPVAWRLAPCAWRLVACAWCLDHKILWLSLGAWRFVVGAACLAYKRHHKPDACIPNKSVSMSVKLLGNGDVQ